MNRRSFSKLLAGTVTAAGVHGISEAERKTASQEVSLYPRSRPAVEAIRGNW